MTKKQARAARRPPGRRARPRVARKEPPRTIELAPIHPAAVPPDDGVAHDVKDDRLTIVGVGMSAGGLEACTQMLEALPPRPGLAIVLIQHLAPHQRSSLPALLGQHCPVPVVEAANEMAVQPDHVYVIPPDFVMDLADGGLRLKPRPVEPGHQHPVDFFLSSLASVQGDRAIAVILSGTGSDGAAGVREVKKHGGTVLAQQPDTAKYDGMPQAAIETGMVDLVLPPADIGRRIVDVSAPADLEAAVFPGDQAQISDEQFEQLVEVLRTTSGVDFAHYKQPTIRRRILRRMAMHAVSDVDRYIALIGEHPDEARSLYQDMLIHVTRFFREPESFHALATLVFPKLLEQHHGDSPVRIWVAGCATGEEAYSVAITLFEAAGDNAPQLNVQIFGTDVSEAAVEAARQGVYAEHIADDVPPDKLRRFFTRADGGYRISKMIRDRCVFARQDLTRDPPFSKLDLVVCRNVLIYMNAALQRRVLPIFHYALRHDGWLMLGQAETIGANADLFAMVEKKYKIYRKRPVESTAAITLPVGYPVHRPPIAAPPGHEIGREARVVQNEANRTLLERYGPPGVLVNEDLEILQFRGHTGAYLEPPPGDASLNLLKLTREGLLHALRSALQAARKLHKPVRKEGLRVRTGDDDEWKNVDIEVIPLGGLSAPHFLVMFDEPRVSGGRGRRNLERARRPAPGKDGRRTERLEEELAATREYLQSIIQEVEAANEELQSANEEILSSNEELQSTNEELDTAKEELQSTNEELNTLNEELHGRNEELTRANSDLVNLLANVQIAIVIVSTDLRIRRFTPMAEKAMNLIPADVGRPITQVKPNIQCADLGDLIVEVIDKITAIEREVQDVEGRWYSLRIRPYKGLENRIEGAVIAVVDVDSAKRRDQDLVDSQRARDYSEAIIQTVREPILVIDSSLRVRTANRAFCDLFQVSRPEAEGRYFHTLGDGQWDIEPLRKVLQDVLREKRTLDHYEVEANFPAIGHRMMLLNARTVVDATGHAEPLIIVAFEDATRV